MKFEPVVWEMLFKDIFIWSSGGPFVQPSGTICAILVEVIMRNNCEFFFEFGPVVQEMSFKKTFICSSGDPFVQQRGTICAILVQGIKNNSMKLF